ncbi:hypothetical protein FQA39_LY07213 [Lamprigera yunnana]|nr:hypothetical protein FQA39_LY07213 [Lamprigera yunnana]
MLASIKSSLIVIFIFKCTCLCYVITHTKTHWLLDVKDEVKTNSSSKISLKALNVSRDMVLGLCSPLDEVVHEESIIVNNDGKSQLNGTILINVHGPVYITCVMVLDQLSDGDGAYPNFVDGGVGYNYVIFNVTAAYGKGFSFKIHVKGYSLDESDENVIK